MGEEKRSCLCLFIALFHHGNHLIYSEHFSIHLLLSESKTHFLSVPWLRARAFVCVCVKECVKSHGNREEAGKLAACRLHMGNCANEVTPHKQTNKLVEIFW